MLVYSIFIFYYLTSKEPRMPTISLIISDKLLSIIDAEVKKRQQQIANPEPFKVTLTQHQEALLIAKDKGIGASNAYLRALRPVKERVSRNSIMLESLELGLITSDILSQINLETKAKPAEEPVKKGSGRRKY
jgi:hypothetical protein